MEFRVLGPVEASYEGRLVRLGAAKERSLLALLLLRRNQVVPVDALVEELWEGDSPESAVVALRVHVSRLRKSLGTVGAATDPGVRA